MAGVGRAVAPAAVKLAPLVVGGMFPFTGSKSLLSQWGTHGVAVGIYEVNQRGRPRAQAVSSYVDDAADSVDALPAFRKLLLSHPTVVIGPFSPTIEAVINQFQPNDVVDFMVGGLTTLDNMKYPFVFRTSSSDSNEAIAMAYYAISKGWKTASLIFDNSANSQGFVPPIMKAFKALGGKIHEYHVDPWPVLVQHGTDAGVRQQAAGHLRLDGHPDGSDPVLGRSAAGLHERALDR